ncbi:MAG: serine/threonine-protein kinase [Planctomycetota bacterium]|nr:serine/threonine-protein kinase [Planctomycetota bacterium]
MSACPTLERLVEFAHDAPSARDSAAIEAHVEGCAECGAALAQIRSDEALEGDVRRALAPKDAQGSTPRLPSVPGYTLERELGRGGMGVVFAAVQIASGRRVAIKVVRGASWVGDAALRSFRREIAVLARLSHPWIAALYDAGATAEGEHYFAMELVQGRTLLRDADARTLSRPERLLLFAKVCDAIQHAHAHGVVHRDVKPSNILVDERGEPRVLDFGLAKFVEGDLALTTAISEPGAIRGTIAYMSPEQARGDGAAVGPASDVYALGVVLYELLTAALPNDVSRVSLPEAVRAICEEPPRRPSLRDPSLRGDLETILLKALEKEPGRRYASAAALADDLRHFLADEVIAARPPSSAYQLRKLVARHKLAFGAAAAIFVIAVGSAIALGSMYARAERGRIDAESATGRESVARRAADEARAEADRQRVEAQTQRALAEQRRALAEEQTERKQSTLDFFMEMIGRARFESAGPDVKVADVVANAGREIETRTDLAPGIASAIALNVAGVENSLGRHARAEELLRFAIAKRALSMNAPDGDDAFLQAQLAVVLDLLGKRSEAEVALSRAEEVLAGLTDPPPRIPIQVALQRAKLQKAIGDVVGAEAALRNAFAKAEVVHGPLGRETLTVLTELVILLGEAGRVAEAGPLVEELVARQERANGPLHPNTLNAKVTLAMQYLDEGRNEEARALLETTLAEQERQLGPANQQVLLTTNNLAGAYSRLKQNDRALEIWLGLLPRQEALQGPRSLGALNTRKNIGTMLYEMKRFDEAAAQQRDFVERCAEALPKTHYLGVLGRTALAKTLITQKSYTEAETLLLGTLGDLGSMHGANPSWTRNAASLLVAAYERSGEPDKAEPYRELARTGVAQ